MDILLSGLHFASLGTAAEVNIGLYQAHQVASALTTALFLLAMLLMCVCSCFLAQPYDLLHTGFDYCSALGWKITRVSLAPKELQMLSVSFALYTVVAVAVAFCETPQACSALQLAEYVMRSLMMLGIIIAMNFNITVRLSPAPAGCALVLTMNGIAHSMCVAQSMTRRGHLRCRARIND